MRISNISSFSPIRFTSTDKKASKNTVSQSMDVLLVHNKAGLCLPTSSASSPVRIVKRQEEQEMARMRAEIFRDDELFDETRDVLDFGYGHYDKNDVLPEPQYRNFISENYFITKASKFNINKEFDTHIEKPTIDYSIKNLMNEKQVEDNTEHTDLRLDDAAYLNKASHKIYSVELSEFIHDDSIKNVFLPETIIKITNASKLVKDNGNEYVDYELLDDGFKLAKNRHLTSDEDVVSIMQNCILKNADNDEYYSDGMMRLHKKVIASLPVKDTLEVCKEALVTKSTGEQVFSPNLALVVLGNVKNRNIEE